MIKENIQNIQLKINEAAQRAGRDPKDIQLIAVSKTYPVSAIEEAIANGCSSFGENKVQELMQKIPCLPKDVQWHLIGHLQTNKVKYIVDQVAMIHSVDTLKLAQEIEIQAKKKNVKVNILIEVNVANESSKYGVKVEETLNLIKEISTLSHVKVKGLMTVAPFVNNPEKNRKIFRKLYQLSVDIKKQNIDNIDIEVLSMGMSNDYEIAIQEGATMIRIGTALFGQRDYTGA